MSARFTVTWHPSAIDELAQIWLSAIDRNAVTNAVSAIDAILRNEPQKKGDEFYGDRIIVAMPLAVTFAVNEADRIVQVLQVSSPE